ncbi:MAG: hypothetical protein HKN78_02895 [Sphingomonadaceae bacterium]|nr:hypothetical protein [Sphingomonadaceae bacterium]
MSHHCEERRNGRQFSLAGELGTEVEGVVDDGCEASCVDWYGNARPIFLGNRIFALMGYELVEGRMRSGRISEMGRLNYGPRAVANALNSQLSIEQAWNRHLPPDYAAKAMRIFLGMVDDWSPFHLVPHQRFPGDDFGLQHSSILRALIRKWG